MTISRDTIPRVPNQATVTAWRGHLTNVILDAVRAMGVPNAKGGFSDAKGEVQRKTNSSRDALSWLRCESDDDAPAYSIMEVYDGRLDEDGIVLRVRKATTNAKLYCGNEAYPLYGGTLGWIKLITPYEPVQVGVDPFSSGVEFLDNLEVVDTYVVSGNNIKLRSLSSWFPSTGTGTAINSWVPVLGAITEPAGLIRFVIQEVLEEQVEFCRAAICIPLSKSCGGDILSQIVYTGTNSGTETHPPVLVLDRLGCLFNEDSQTLVGRLGYAAKMDALDFYATGTSREDFGTSSGPASEECRYDCISLCCPPEGDTGTGTFPLHHYSIFVP